MGKITGVMVNYYFVCKRKLWYFNKNISMESENELVGLGKLIDENSYGREKKSVLVDEIINIDFLKDWEIIHEVKKSNKIEEASIWQLKYYLWVLKERGVKIEKGILDYPKLRKRIDVELSESDESEIKNIVSEINIILEKSLPPEKILKKFCKSCSYYELCYI